MATTATATLAFPQFSLLPPELRNSIWREALPDDIQLGPVLVPFKEGCWQCELLGPDNTPAVLFRPELLDAVQLEIPIAFVNREARSIALAWLRKQTPLLRMRRRKEQDPIYVRPFDGEVDTLYVDQSQLDADALWEEPHELIYKSYEEYVKGCNGRRGLRTLRPKIQRIAIALNEELLKWHEPLKHIFLTVEDYYSENLSEMLVVVNAPPELQSVADDDSKADGSIPPRWEYVGTGGDEYIWDDEGLRFKENEEAGPVGDGVISSLYGSNVVGAGGPFPRYHNPPRNPRITIRPVSAIRK